MQNKQYEITEVPLTNINSFWLRDSGYDITIGEDARGDPYISIAINRRGSRMKLQEIDNSWRGKIIKVVGTAHVRPPIQKTVDNTRQARYTIKRISKTLSVPRLNRTVKDKCPRN